MADDLTDALRAVIEPMHGELVSAAQAHFLASIRQEISDTHRHAERALELIGRLIPEDTEPHWSQKALRDKYTPTSPQPGESAQANRMVKRGIPKPGELWRFIRSRPEGGADYLEAEVQDTDPSSCARHAVIPDGDRAGYGFRFDRATDPAPFQLLRYADTDRERSL